MWAPEEVAKLHKLILQGMGAELAAKKLGRTKNSIIGEAHRIWGGYGRHHTPANYDPNNHEKCFWVASVDFECISYGTDKESVICDAVDILNRENPPYERKWYALDVETMLKRVPKSIFYRIYKREPIKRHR